MPERPFTRDQHYLLPPSTEELVDARHPIRYVDAFVESLDRDFWTALERDDPQAGVGAPRYAPRVLLSVWIAGFMLGIRSCRELERTCRESIPFRWLTAGQTPDHNTLWRFYDGHRQSLRTVLRETVETAVGAGLVDLALQAVDGSKVLAQASKDRVLSAAELATVLAKVEVAIGALEAQNVSGEDPPPDLPEGLRDAQMLRARVRAARAQVDADRAAGTRVQQTVNLTDPEARWMQTRQGLAPAYNAQAVVAALQPERAGRPGRIILAAAVSRDNTDNALLAEMIGAAKRDDAPPPVTVADAGYYSGPALAACAEAGYVVVVPTTQPHQRRQDPYSKAHFRFDPVTNTYTCPQDQVLTYRGTTPGRRGERHALYRSDPSACRTCPAFGRCTTDHRHGRALQIAPQEPVLRAHAAKMDTAEAIALLDQRKGLIEPVFGILKEGHGARRSRVRGWAKVETEWSLLAAGFNLRTLARAWATPGSVLCPGSARPSGTDQLAA